MSTTRTAAPRYAAGQAVEVQVVDFTTAGFPTVWALGTVLSVVARDGGLFDVMVRTEGGGYSPQIVGKRGGNRNLREAA